MLQYLIQGITLGFSAGVSPGPLQAYFLSQTLRAGWKKTIPAAFAPLISDGPIIALVLLVLTQTPGWFLGVLRFFGGIFILYLAWRAFQSVREDLSTKNLGRQGVQSLRDATMMNLLNPQPYIFWSTILGPILIDGWRENPVYGLSFIAGFYTIMILIFIGLIIIYGTISRFGPKISKFLNAISALALFGFGLYQIWAAVSLLQ